MATVTCEACGAQNDSRTAVCTRCGAALGAPALPAASPYLLATQAQWALAIPTKARSGSLWLFLGAGVLALMVGLGIATVTLQPKPPQAIVYPPPPRRPPLVKSQTYVSTKYGFSLQYSNDIPRGAESDSSITWKSGKTTVLSAIGVSQQGRSPQQIVAAALRNIYAGAQPAYAIPGAEVGYNSAAYGAVYDILVDPGTGQAVPSRLVIIAAVRKNVAVEVVGFGPVRPASPESFDQPNPSLLGISQTLDEILNTVTWAGDPPL